MIPDSITQFVEHLRELRDRKDRAALAALRRGLGKPPGTAVEMYRYVIPFAPERRQTSYFLVAALFASYPNAPALDGNLGVSFRHLTNKDDSGGSERRFVALLRADSDALPTHLRHVIALFQSSSRQIPVSWEQLLHDLGSWDHPNRFVQRAWARAFWETSSAPATPEDASASITHAHHAEEA